MSLYAGVRQTQTSINHLPASWRTADSSAWAWGLQDNGPCSPRIAIIQGEIKGVECNGGAKNAERCRGHQPTLTAYFDQLHRRPDCSCWL